ncbi:site-specific integrase [Enterococcus sp. ALS3]|uniref:Site-specific integrase n=1 Tax=Enterococcus alishanensis TaxID=1303817 RepID=A0ABS6TF23_9ENTE|nr:site-specific integrase [Enterococcus alishanensis]MBV7391510.1 site-specific integrase [Enterococcus alishanensis]
MSRRGENIYKRKDGRWEGRFIKGRKDNGQIKYGYIYNRSYAEVRNRLYALKVKYQTIRELKGEGAIPVTIWGEQWIHSIQDTVKPSTYASYKYKLLTYVYPSIGQCLLNELDKEQLQMLIMTWKKRGLSSSSIQVIYRVLYQCLNEAVRQGKLKTNPCLQIQLPKVKKNKVSSLSVRQQKQLESVINGKKGKGELAVLLGLSAGLRIGEIAALRWEDVDFDRGILKISHTYQRILLPLKNKNTQLCYTDSKSDASIRLIPMTQQLRASLLAYRKKSQGNYILEAKGKPCEPRLLTYYFHKLRSKACLDDIHFHQLRHTFATRCIESNGDIASISALLGHASTQMTLDTYADAKLEQRFQVISMLEEKSA